MGKKKLKDILEVIGNEAKAKGLTLNLKSNIFFEILNENNINFSKFKSIIISEWEDFKTKNQSRLIKKSYTTFFYQTFHQYFEHYIHEFCGFNQNQLKLINQEKISDNDLFFEYTYSLSKEEITEFSYFSNNNKDNLNGLTSPFVYLYLIISILGVVIRKLLQEKFFIILDGAVINNGEEGKNISFFIVIKNSNDETYQNYYFMFLFYFLKYFNDIPEEYTEKLLRGREKLYQLALEQYPFAKEKLVDLLYYFYKKCNLLHNFSPLLDFLNFVCSRVEDSIYSKLEVIKKDFLANFDYTEEKKNSLLRIFDFLDKKSTLYSTFQANNLPSTKNQFNLFLLYMKYYFGGGSLEALEVGDLLLLPKKFKAELNRQNNDSNITISANSIKDIQNFMDHLSLVSNMDALRIIFEKIFGLELAQVNYDFFKTFLRSLNLDISMLIEKENKILSENPRNGPLTFNTIIDHICRMLYTLIDKIFIRKMPEQASTNFIDPRSRYVGKNIALRVLELFIFQDLNVSDDVWPDYLISLNKVSLRKELKPYDITIPDKYFYSFQDIIRFVITYNFQSDSDQELFEEWLINEIIIPLTTFIQTIRKLITKGANTEDVLRVIKHYFLSNGKIIELNDNLSFALNQLTPFFVTTN
ncbi:MAG: hypothetical protein EU531_02660 [Promethearchaeota archaeon]|nr:MAG: hypothetical protein EU531_02660 [Candidatus Lokiarchaeota archaeon]